MTNKNKNKKYEYLHKTFPLEYEEAVDILKDLDADEAVDRLKTANNIKIDKKQRRVVFLTDMHIPLHNVTATNAAIKFVKDFKPTHLIIGSDMLDLACLSKFTKDTPGLLSRGELKNEFTQGLKMLRRLRRIVGDDCKMVYLEGNHEFRIHDLYDRYPQFDGMFDLDENLKFEELNIEFMPMNKPYMVGKLGYVHGTYCGANAAKKHLQHYKRNLVIGHLHHVEVHTDSRPEDELYSWTCEIAGCLCDMNPPYMKNKPHNWQTAFHIAYIHEDDTFDSSIIRIHDGKFTYAGRLYNGN